MAEHEDTAVRPENAAAFGGPLMRALGIDPATVTGFTITCDGGEFPVVQVRRILREGDGAAVRAVLQEFELRLRAEAPATSALPAVVFDLNSSCGTALHPAAAPARTPA